MTPADVKYSFDLAKIATHPQHPLWADTGLKSTKVVGQRRRLHASRRAPATSSSTSTATTSRSSRSTSSRATTPRTSRRATSTTRRRSSAPGPYVVPVGRRRHVGDGRLEEARRLVGVEGARPERRADVRGRHQERHERRGAVEPARRQHRPVQQLRAEDGDQGQVQDVLQRRSVPPRREHDVAVPEHDEEAARTTSSSAARWPSRST